MTEDPKPLRELNVKPGDVVRPYNAGKSSRLWPPKNYTIQPCGGIIDAGGDMWGGSSNDFPDYPPYRRFIIVSRAAPKPWRDMTPEEKGALLLARHEGKTIETFLVANEWVKIEPSWTDSRAYRVRPKPVRETVELWWRKVDRDDCREGRCGTIDLIDGKPDPASVNITTTTGDNK